jgi:hypothetical protein
MTNVFARLFQTSVVMKFIRSKDSIEFPVAEKFYSQKTFETESICLSVGILWIESEVLYVNCIKN